MWGGWACSSFSLSRRRCSDALFCLSPCSLRLLLLLATLIVGLRFHPPSLSFRSPRRSVPRSTSQTTFHPKRRRKCERKTNGVKKPRLACVAFFRGHKRGGGGGGGGRRKTRRNPRCRYIILLQTSRRNAKNNVRFHDRSIVFFFPSSIPRCFCVGGARGLLAIGYGDQPMACVCAGSAGRVQAYDGVGR